MSTAADVERAFAKLPRELVDAISLRVDGIHLTTGLFGPAWAQRDDVSRLVLWAGAFIRRRAPSADQIEALLAHPALEVFEQLAVYGLLAKPARTRALLESPLGRRVSFLCLHVATNARVLALLRSPPLEQLEVAWTPQSPPLDLRVLAALEGLRALRIANGRFGIEGLRALASSSVFEALDGHSFVDAALGDDGAEFLAQLAPRFGDTTLDFAHSGLGDRGALALLTAPWRTRITHLRFWDNAVGDAVLEALPTSPLAASLTQLVLDRTNVSALGVERLVRAYLDGALPALTCLQASESIPSELVHACGARLELAMPRRAQSPPAQMLPAPVSHPCRRLRLPQRSAWARASRT